MLKTILVLPDGTEVSSGAGTVNAIQSVTLTECVNDSEELTLGSTCANALEATLITPAGGLALDAGTEVVMHKESGGVRQQIGVFTLEKPTRPSANTMKVTGYDHVSKLDKDLTAWLSGLDAWPYTLTTFADMVCEACGLIFKKKEVPNGDFLVDQFTRSSVTGRQLMQWIGEICCRFCRANPYGEIEFAWYTDSGKVITTGGELYYFQNSLTYENYTTVEIEAVQIRMADNENGALWPAVEEGVNSYIITGNPILNLRITEELLPVLANIKDALAGVRYTPCKVSVPANLDIRAGNTVKVTDKNGKTFIAYVMTKTQAGQKDTLECTGSHRRDTPAAVSNQSGVAAAQKALDNMTLEDVFLKLTKNGKLKGLYMQDGELYINASYLLTGILSSRGKNPAFYLDLDNGILKMSASEFSVKGKSVDEIAAEEAAAAVQEYSKTVTKNIGDLQAQIDGNITSWFYDYEPTTSNKPASEWKTDELKNQHLGDLFYIVNNEEKGGLAYRWALVDKKYLWQLVKDVEVAKALADAAKAQDTADKKRRTFIAKPKPPYDEGDLWTDGADLMICETARATGSYVASDWKLATDYINAEKAAAEAKKKVDEQSQSDIWNKLFDGGKVQGFDIVDGKLYINGAEAVIQNLTADNMTAGRLQSKDKSTYFDLSSGEFVCKKSDGTKVRINGGTTFFSDANGKVRLFALTYANGASFIFLNENSETIGQIFGHGSDFKLSAYDSDLGQQMPYKMVWKNINGVKTLVGQ